ncbi:hypothetical protein ANCDUO_20697 [Ancylostoma duodenale]|uniref:Uncharacterized protein n=1 Tax=Ancylostoma duodenale TaxID=51022 RepID=A0A0C2FRC7_9BILA|nr:hypothetical protein ANCDUO_20697 [Ancylostoma duodenale]
MSSGGWNVNAAAFVPNVNARPFVPGQPYIPAEPAPPPAPPVSADPPVEEWDAEVTDAPAEVVEESVPAPEPVPETKAPEPEAEKVESAAGDDKDASEASDVIAPLAKKFERVAYVDDGTHKEHVNMVFIGHVDAGQLMYLTGMVDKRTLEKYEREAKEKGRESW